MASHAPPVQPPPPGFKENDLPPPYPGMAYQDQPGYGPAANPSQGYPPAGNYPSQGYPPAGNYPSQGYPPAGNDPSSSGGYPSRGYYPPAASDTSPLNPEEFGSFSDKAIRRGFIRKVYGILTVQLSVTIAVMCPFVFSQNVKEYINGKVVDGELVTEGHQWLVWVALAAVFVCLIALACCPGVRRSFPTNIIFLGLFTLCEGFMLGVVATRYEPDAVMIAAGICAIVVFGLTLFAFQTRIDFTSFGGCLFVTLLVFICFGFFAIFFHTKILHLVYSCIGALIFCIFLVFDTQMMMGGKHKYSLSPEEYIFAALNLYLDIINLFLYILSIVGLAKN